MLKDWHHEIQILVRLLSVQIRGQMQYRTSFWFDIVGAAFVMFTEFGAIALVFPKFEDIDGWNLSEIAFLFGMINLSFGFMDMVFSGFDDKQFGRLTRQGGFDQLLLRPVNISIQVLGSDFQLRRLGRVFLGAGVLFFAMSTNPIHWTVLKIILLILTLSSQFLYFGGLFLVAATFTFWTIESIEAMNILTYGGTELITYPMTIYPLWMRRFFTWVMPAIFLNYYPALYILEKADPFNFPYFAPWLAPISGLLIFSLAVRFWHYGISKYQSSGT